MGELHCLNVGCADCTVIRSGNDSYLVDCHDIESHSNLLPQDKRLRGVIITHQHYDHFDGLDFLRRNNYSIDILAYSPYERRNEDSSVEYDEWQAFKNLRDYFEGRGTKLYFPYRQESFDRPWWDAGMLRFFVLGPASHITKSPTRELHDASLVLHVTLGKRACLFAGDASDTSLRHVADNTTGFCGDILHASHHGSINGAELEFVKKCNASETLVSTKSGVHSNVPSSTAMQRYSNHTKKKVWRTDISGSVKWTF